MEKLKVKCDRCKLVEVEINTGIDKLFLVLCPDCWKVEKELEAAKAVIDTSFKPLFKLMDDNLFAKHKLLKDTKRVHLLVQDIARNMHSFHDTIEGDELLLKMWKETMEQLQEIELLTQTDL